MRAAYLIRIPTVFSSQLLLAGLMLPTLLFAQSAERALQYKVGEIARETIIAPETIRVTLPPDPQVSNTRLNRDTPALYAYQSSVFQGIQERLTEDWTEARERYLDSLNRVFGKRTFRSSEISSETFLRLTNSFQSEYDGFPFTDEIARRWAAGNTQSNELQRYLATIEEFMSSYFIRPDEDAFAARGTGTEVEVTTVRDRLPTRLSEVRGTNFVRVPLDQFLTVSQARSRFESQTFVTNRALRRYLSQSIQANTRYLRLVSEERWRTDPSVSSHALIFEPGDIIVREGDIVTRTIKEALDLLIVSLRYNRLKDSVKIELAREPRPGSEETPGEAETNPAEEAPPSTPAPQPQQRENIRERSPGKLPPILSPTTVAQTDASGTPTAQATDLAMASSAPASSLISRFTRWMVGFALLLILGILVFLHFRRGPPVYIGEEQLPAVVEDRKQSLVKALTSQLTQTLFKQRQELLKSKEEATAQVAAMENRLAKLQPEIFDKLAAYEKKIKELEEQLRQQGVSQEMMNQDLKDPVTRPIFDDLIGSVEGEENLEVKSNVEAEDEDNKEVPFPGHAVADELDDDGPQDLLEEVMEDLEVEDGFENRIARGSDR